MFTKVSRDKEDLNNGTSSDIQTTLSKMKNTQIRIYVRLDIAEKKNERLVNLRT